MTEQVVVPFTIEGYTDELVFDVVSMTASHLLLGKPSQFHPEVAYIGRTNTYSISKDEKHILLTPLSPCQAM